MVAGPRNQIVRFCTPNYDFPRFPALDGAALDVVAPRSGSPKEGEPPAADTISGYTLLHDDPNLVNERLDLLRSITPQEVKHAAAQWLLPALNAQARVLPDSTERQP